MKSPSSFRDPSGFIFSHKGQIYRQINRAGAADFDQLTSSGLYDELANASLIISHQEDKPKDLPADDQRYKVIKPAAIPFISYPYEWSFEQLKDAALLTLDIQKRALKKGMILKDASAYNVQFIGSQPIFIDTLSLTIYEPGASWIGYKQFCEHFLAPLAVASYNSADTLKLATSFLDGMPLSLATRLLPLKARLSKGLVPHLYLHAAAQKRYDRAGFQQSGVAKQRRLSRLALDGLIDSLERAVKKLKPSGGKTTWGNYYQSTNYSSVSFKAKQNTVKNLLDQIKPEPKLVWDFGANDGTFSEIAAQSGIYTVSFDIDQQAISKNYLKERSGSLRGKILPLTQDLTNPSPAIGWSNAERASLIDRGPADVGLALALVHHLAIGNNLPLESIAAFFSRTAKWLIIEFVPKGDSMVEVLLRTKTIKYEDYAQTNFEAAFAKHYKLIRKQPVRGSKRVIYLYSPLSLNKHAKN